MTQTSESAPFHVFADSAYQLFVNGTLIGFGPVRFDPRFPVYDSFELAPFIQLGRNVVAVQVKYFGAKCYKAIENRAGFIAWGGVISGTEPVGFDTGSTPWKAAKNRALGRYTPKLSFALDPVDHFDQGSENAGWTHPGFDDSDWAFAEPLTSAAWGPLSPRSIPSLGLTPFPVERVFGVLPLRNGETLISFSLPTPHVFADDKALYSPRVCFDSWIWSPVEQRVPIGSFWGETWLNGVALHPGYESPNQSLRLNQIWHLQKGWNYFFGKVELYRDVLDYYIGVPRSAKLQFSARKDLATPEVFRRSRVVTIGEFNQYLKNKALPYDADEALAGIGGWEFVGPEGAAANPCFETSWDVYGAALEGLDPKDIVGHVFRKDLYPDGFAVLLDLGQTHCLIPALELEGATATTVDLTYSEHLCSDREHFRHNHLYYGGDRLVGAKASLAWMASQPRGMRYLKITVRGAQGDVRLKKLVMHSAGYPVAHVGSFTCSDPMLNEIWQLCRRTQQANMEDAFVDCPTRERGMYSRDVVIQYHNNLALFGDQRLMMRCLELYAQMPEPTTGKFRAVAPTEKNYTIADFCLNLLEGYESYWRHSGDLDLILMAWPSIQANLAWFHKLADEQPDTLLLDSEWHIKQGTPQAYGGFHGDNGIPPGVQDNTGLHCSFSCDYLVALRQALTLACALDKQNEADELTRRIRVLEASIPATFWNSEKGCFADNHKKTTHSIHASLLAVRAGVVSPEQIPHVRAHARRCLGDLFINGVDPSFGANASPAYAYYLLDALYRLEMPDLAERVIRQGWGWMLSRGLSTCPEFFNEANSLCHAWSAHPAWYLSSNVLGVSRLPASNPDAVQIHVKCGSDLLWAEGAFPHPKGMIKVKWHRDGNGLRVFDYIHVPDGVQVEFR